MLTESGLKLRMQRLRFMHGPGVWVLGLKGAFRVWG